jgi:hypothetical protein
MIRINTVLIVVLESPAEKIITVELHLSGRWLSGSAWPFGQICP